jgi:hypothetical protein
MAPVYFGLLRCTFSPRWRFHRWIWRTPMCHDWLTRPNRAGLPSIITEGDDKIERSVFELFPRLAVGVGGVDGSVNCLALVHEKAFRHNCRAGIFPLTVIPKAASAPLSINESTTAAMLNGTNASRVTGYDPLPPVAPLRLSGDQDPAERRQKHEYKPAHVIGQGNALVDRALHQPDPEARATATGSMKRSSTVAKCSQSRKSPLNPRLCAT